MNHGRDDASAAVKQTLPDSQAPVLTGLRLTRWFLRALILTTAGTLAFYWSGLSALALIRFDRTGLDLGGEWRRLPIDRTATLINCLGPIGWLIGAGVFALAFTMSLAVYRWRWPLRIIIAAAPTALVLYLTAYVWDLHPWVRPVCLSISAAQVLLAALAAILCRPIAERLQRVAPTWLRRLHSTR